jgi:hypothetical protein
MGGSNGYNIGFEYGCWQKEMNFYGRIIRNVYCGGSNCFDVGVNYGSYQNEMKITVG